jgi:ribonuclease HI
VSKNVPKNFPITVFADGASSGNPGPGGWGVIIATPSGEVRELGGANPETTNNRMELTAVIRALDHVRDIGGEVAVYTDSVYVIRGITQWIWAWRKNGWKSKSGEEVANPDLWKQLSAIVGARGKESPVRWHFVRGHSGIPGNERTDEIAVSFSRGRPVPLYAGPLLKYSVAVFDIPEKTGLPEMRPVQEKKAAYSYVSLIGGVAARHSTWAECEARVKGRSGAKFKKAMSAEEEEEILASWGVDPQSV